MRQHTAVGTLQQTQMCICSLARFIKTFQIRCRTSQNYRNTAQLRPFQGYCPRMIIGPLVLLVTALMFFINNYQAQIAEGSKNS